MSRKSSNTVDYFPHDAHKDRTVNILKSNFGNIGYACWYQLLELLCTSENHYYDCREVNNWDYLLACLDVDEQTGVKILNLLAKLGNIDPKLWAARLIWSDCLVKNLEGVYKNRKRPLPCKSDLLAHFTPDGGIPGLEIKMLGTGEIIPVVEMPQSRVQETIVKKSRVEEDTTTLLKEGTKEPVYTTQPSGEPVPLTESFEQFCETTLRTKFPLIDLSYELEKWRLHNEGKTITNPKLIFWNWLENAEKYRKKHEPKRPNFL